MEENKITPTKEQERTIELLNIKIRRAIKIGKSIDAVILIFLLLIGAYIVSSIYSDIKFQNHGQDLVKYHDFDELLKTNPDTVAWITMEGTKIDLPVVQGKDNFEYLDKDFYGDHYSAGTLFLDYKNTKDFSDNYNIIHGHHMTNGNMFGDLTRYQKKEFFDKHKDGTLLTPTYDYDLEVFAVAVLNAYDATVYNPKGSSKDVYSYVMKIADNKRDISLDNEKVLTLSTCSGEMNENRVVVFTKMYNKRTHE